MTDEELKTYRDVAKRDLDVDLQMLVDEVDRLREENRRLVRLAIRSEELARWHENFELASELRAAIRKE